MMVLGDALRRAGYERPRERAERLMVEAIETVEGLMGSAVDRRSLKGPSIAEFSRRLLEANDASLIWELFSEWREEALSGLYDRVLAEKRGQLADRETAEILNAGKPVSPGRAPVPRPNGLKPGGPQSATAAGLGMGAVTAAARRSLLRTFLVNGRPLSDVTAGEARGFAKSRARDARFLALLTERLPDHVRIGDAVSEEEAERAYQLASAADNE